MLEPVRIPSGQQTTTMDAVRNPINAIKQQRDLEAQDRDHALGHSSSEEWSDKEHKDGLGSPTTLANLARSETSASYKQPKEEKASSTLQTPRAWMGLQPLAAVDEELDHAGHNHLLWSKVKITFKEPFAEFWGTFILVLFGDAAIAQVTLSKGSTNTPGGGMAYGDWNSIAWGYGIGLMLGIYVAGDSGAFLK